MDSKFYVSLEAARLLKEKGYNEECDYCFYYDDYNDKWDFDYPHNLFDDEPMHYNNENIDDEMYSMPSLLEAMDWLEQRGIYVEIRLSSIKIKGIPMVISPDDKYEYKYFFIIVTRNSVTGIFEDGEDGCLVTYSDKYECMNAFIKKGLELL